MKERLKTLGLSKYGMEQLLFLIQDYDDYVLFLKEFWEGKSKELKSIANFRQLKMEQNEIDFVQFIEMYRRDKIKALETLFQHRVVPGDVERLEDIMDKQGVTLHDLYIDHVQDRKKSLLTWLSTARKTVSTSHTHLVY